MDYENLIIYPIPPAHYFWSGMQQIPLILLKMKIHSSSCKIEDFVETHLRKLCDTPIARITGVVCPH